MGDGRTEPIVGQPGSVTETCWERGDLTRTPIVLPRTDASEPAPDGERGPAPAPAPAPARSPAPSSTVPPPAWERASASVRGGSGTARRIWLTLDRAVVASTALVWVLVAALWFRPGWFFATGDWGPFLRRGVAGELATLWSHQNSGAGGPAYSIVRGVDVAFITLARWLGGGEPLGQRLLYASIAAFGACGAAALVRRFSRSPLLVLAAGPFAAFNVFYASRVQAILPALAMGLIGLFTAWAVDAARGSRPSSVRAAVATVPLGYLALNPPLVGVVTAWLLSLPLLAIALAGGGRHGAGRVVAFGLRTAAFTVPLAAWWAVPQVLAIRQAGEAGLMAAETTVASWEWTHRYQSLANVTTLRAAWAWPDERYYGSAGTLLSQPSIVWTLWIAPMALALAPLLTRGRARRTASVLALLAVAAIVAGKGLHAPLRDLNLALYDLVPGFWLLRAPMSKVGPILVLVEAVALALTLDALRARWADPVRSAAAGAARAGALAAFAALLAVAPAVTTLPLATGSALGDTVGGVADRVRPPEGWWQLAAAVDGSPQSGKLLVLPFDDYYQMPTTWGYYGTDVVARGVFERPVIDRTPQGYISRDAAFDELLRALDEAVRARRVEVTAGLLARLGVSHVLVRTDFDRASILRQPSIADAGLLTDSLAATPGLQLALANDVGSLYEVRAEVPESAPGDRPGGRADGTGSGSGGTVEALAGVVTVAVDPATTAATAPAASAAAASVAARRSDPTASDASRLAEADTVAALAAVLPASIGIVTSADADRVPGAGLDRAPDGDAAGDAGPLLGEAVVDGWSAGGGLLARHASGTWRYRVSVEPDASGADRDRIVLRDTQPVTLPDGSSSARQDLVVPVAPEPGLGVLPTGASPGAALGLDVSGRLHLLGSTDTVRLDEDEVLTPLLDTGVEAISNWSPVGDCRQSADPDAPDGSHVRRDVVVEGERRIVLEADLRAACTWSDLPGAIAETTFVFQLVARSIEGRPPRACLWATGPDRCVTLPLAREVDGWTVQQGLVRLPVGTTSARLFLYADAEDPERAPASAAAAGGDEPVRTVVEYGTVSLRTLVAGAAHPVSGLGVTATTTAPTAADADAVASGDGPATAGGSLAELLARVVGQPSVGSWSKGQNCGRREVTGATSATSAGSGAPPAAVRLTTSAPGAISCVVSPLRGLAAGRTYAVTIAHRVEQGRPPRICAYHLATKACLRIETDGRAALTLPATEAWTRTRVTFRLPAAADPAVQLFVYADPAVGGTTIDYADPRLALVDRDRFVSLPAAVEGAVAPALSWRTDGPADYRITMPAAPETFAIALDEAHDRRWVLEGLPEGATAAHVRLDGYRNGWLVDLPATTAPTALELRIRYGPDRWVHRALVISALAGLLLAGLGVRAALRHRERPAEPLR